VNSIRLGQSHAQFVRFVLIGAANTLVTGLIFLALSTVVASAVAYTVAFGLGLAFVVVATPRIVFLVRTSHARRAAYALWYAVVYLVGLMVVWVLSDRLRVDRVATVVITLAVTASLSFLGGRRLFGSPTAAGPG
jgi:putative flippase GtrA